MRDKGKISMKKSEAGKAAPVSTAPKKLSPKSGNRSTDQILHLQGTIGNRAVQQLLKSGKIQAKLTIGKPDDKYEQEADRVADQVMSMPEPGVQRQPEEEKEEIQTKPLAEQITPLVQRQVGPEEEEEPVQTKLLQRQETEEEEEEVQTKLQRQPEEEEEEPVQAKQAGNQASAVTSNINSLKGVGQPLSESTRTFFEPRFGADFSGVRIHNDTQAAETAKSINAKAFTKEKDVVFSAGQYSPETSIGKRLLAHELTHVAQQGNGQYVRRYENESKPSIDIDVNRAMELNVKYQKRLGFNNDTTGWPYPIGSSAFAYQVARYQLEKGLEIDGIMGPETWDVRRAELEGEEESGISGIEDEALTGGTEEDPEIANIDIDNAMEQNIVYNRLLGFADRIEWPYPVGSSAFAYVTAKFQKENDLEIDGMMGPDTWTIRGAELEIDVPAELANWARGRRHDTLIQVYALKNPVAEAMNSLRIDMTPMYHPAQLKRLLNQAEKQLNNINWSKYKDEDDTVSLLVSAHGAAGISDISIKPIEPEKKKQTTSETEFVDMTDLYMMKKHINAIQVYINRYFDWTSVIYFDKKKIAAGIDFIIMEYFTALEVNLTKRGISPVSQLALRAQAALDIKKQIDADKLSKICSEQNEVTLNTQAYLGIGEFSGILDAGIASGTFTGPPGDQVSEKEFEKNLNLMDSVVSNLGHVIEIVDLLPLGVKLSYTCTAAGGILTIIGYPIQILGGLHKIGLANQTDTRLAYARGYSLAMADMHFGRDPSQRAMTSVFGTTRTHENNGRNDAIRYIKNMKGETFAKMLLYNRKKMYSSGQSMATAIWKNLVYDRWRLNTVSIHVGPKF